MCIALACNIGIVMTVMTVAVFTIAFCTLCMPTSYVRADTVPDLLVYFDFLEAVTILWSEHLFKDFLVKVLTGFIPHDLGHIFR